MATTGNNVKLQHFVTVDDDENSVVNSRRFILDAMLVSPFSFRIFQHS